MGKSYLPLWISDRDSHPVAHDLQSVASTASYLGYEILPPTSHVDDAGGFRDTILVRATSRPIVYRPCVDLMHANIIHVPDSTSSHANISTAGMAIRHRIIQICQSVGISNQNRQSYEAYDRTN